MQSFPKNVLLDLKSALEGEEKRIGARIRELSAQDPFSNPDRITDNAASDAEANEESSHDRFSALVGELQASQEDIKQALVRIDNGSYGFCRECKQMIDTDRLGIIPTAILCLSCEQKKKAR